MNADNVRALRDLLARVAQHNPERFNMACFFGDNTWSVLECEDGTDPEPEHCGTSACMAGWCQLVFATTPAERRQTAYQFARDFLGLNFVEAEEWFIGKWSTKDDVTATDAVAFLDQRLAA